MKIKNKFWVFALALYASQGAAHAEREVVIEDICQGCFGGQNVETVYNKQNDKYVAKSKKEFTEKDLKDLVAVIESTKSVSTFDPKSLGITPESVKQHYNDLFNATINAKDPIYKTIKLNRLTELDYKAVCDAAEKRLTSKDVSTNQVRFTATINDPEVSKENIVVESTHDEGYMLPWKVKIGEKSWETYSTALPEKLIQFADKSGQCAMQLDGKKNWNEAFWHDSIFWRRHLGENLHRKHSEKFAKMLPGYAQAEKMFNIESADSGTFNSLPESFYMELKVRNPQKIDSVTWFNIYKNNQPQMTWTQFIQKYRNAESLAQKQTWLAAWKKSNVANKLQICIAGANSYEEPSLKDYVMPAWKNSNMAGVPELAIILMRDRFTCGKVYLSSKEPRALLVEASGGGGSHWFDKQEISFKPESPVYLLVQANGKFEKKSISKNSKLLPKPKSLLEGI